MTTDEKVQALREAMKANGLDAYIIPSSDPHQSEYVADHWKSRAWISGFTGSAGTVVVTMEHAGLWTDSRYFIQAEEQLKGSQVVLHKLNIPHTPEHVQWICENIPDGSSVGCDARLFSVSQIRKLEKHLGTKGLKLKTGIDLINVLWTDRPALPNKPVFEHELKFAGKPRSSKMDELRSKLKSNDYYLLTTLDDIAWLFNLRGSDVACNPVFYAYAIIGRKAAYLFTGPGNIDHDLKRALNNDGVIVKAYDEIENFLQFINPGEKILVDTTTANKQLFDAIPSDAVCEGKNLVIPAKAIKNETEIKHLRNVMRRDAVALLRLYRWLEKQVTDRGVPEAEVAEKLNEFRAEQDHYMGESFDAIVGFRGNGAIVHYKPEYGTCAAITNDGMLLLDSGGQYLDGTTDITRTTIFGAPTAEQKKDFTTVLKGYIQLDMAKFPNGTTGVQLDTLARIDLWKAGLNYGHGTGHGVGFFLNVHEGPQGFSPVPNTPRANTAFEPGMLTSIEPGVYKEGKYGIRIENLVLCREAEKTAFGDFLAFEALTLFPIELDLVEADRLSKEERIWLNNYHDKVYKEVSPLLTEEEKVWLKTKCRAI